MYFHLGGPANLQYFPALQAVASKQGEVFYIDWKNAVSIINQVLSSNYQTNPAVKDPSAKLWFNEAVNLADDVERKYNLKGLVEALKSGGGYTGVQPSLGVVKFEGLKAFVNSFETQLQSVQAAQAQATAQAPAAAPIAVVPSMPPPTAPISIAPPAPQILYQQAPASTAAPVQAGVLGMDTSTLLLFGGLATMVAVIFAMRR